MCVELLCKPNEDWTLHYVAGAIAETDVPSTLVDLIKQRRRWLNGSFFSLVFYIFRFHHLLGRSNHSVFRRLALFVQFIYQLVSLVMTWFAVGAMYLCVYLVYDLSLQFRQDSLQRQILLGMSIIFGVLTVIQVLLSLYTGWVCLKPV
jgi:chitin synthase